MIVSNFTERIGRVPCTIYYSIILFIYLELESYLSCKFYNIVGNGPLFTEEDLTKYCRTLTH